MCDPMGHRIRRLNHRLNDRHNTVAILVIIIASVVAIGAVTVARLIVVTRLKRDHGVLGRLIVRGGATGL